MLYPPSYEGLRPISHPPGIPASALASRGMPNSASGYVGGGPSPVGGHWSTFRTRDPWSAVTAGARHLSRILSARRPSPEVKKPISRPARRARKVELQSLKG